MLISFKTLRQKNAKTKGDSFLSIQKMHLFIDKLWLIIALCNFSYFFIVYLLPLYTILPVPHIPVKSFVEITLFSGAIIASVLLMWHRLTFDTPKLTIEDFLLILCYGKMRIATCCLDITSVPGSVSLDSDSIPRYNTAMLLAIREGMCKNCNITYEVGIVNMQPHLRIFISSVHNDISILRDLLHKEATRIEAILLASLGNVELELLKGKSLIDAADFLSSEASLENIIDISRSIKEHHTLLWINGAPSVHPTESSSQIGTLLSTALRQGDSIRLVCTFSKATVGKNSKSMESQWKHIREREKRKADTLADQITKRKLIKEYDEINDNVGWFNASVYVLCTAPTEKERQMVINRISGLILSIWGGKGLLKIKEISISTRRLIRIITRRHLHGMRMHVSRLAAFINTPVQYTPTISPVETPEFSIPSFSFVENEIIIGHIIYGGRKISNAALKIEWFREHMAILGATGTGKTSLVKRIMAQLCKLTKIPWWIFDVKGSEYVELVQRVDSSILVIKPGFDPSFSIGILEVESKDVQYTIESTFQLLRELLKEHNTSSELTPAMERLLHDSLAKLASSTDKSINNLVRIIKSLSKNEEFGDLTRDALINRLQIITRNPLRKIFDARKSTNLSDLLTRRVIFDLSYVARKGGLDTARFLYNLMAKRIFDKAMSRGIKQGLHHVIVLEEANNLVPESYTRSSSADVTTGESMVMLQRATGQGVIVVSTRPNISSNILANTATKIMFRLPYDSAIGARFLSLNGSQERYLRTLKRGQAIVVMPQTEAFEIITEPFILPDSHLDETGNLESLEHEKEEDAPEPLSSARKSAKVFDRNSEITTHVIAWLASQKMATENQLIGLLQSINNTIDKSDAQEIIGDMVSIGSIERETIPLVEGGAIYALPSHGLESVKNVIIEYIREHLCKNNESEIGTDIVDLIINDTAIMTIPEHITSSVIPLIIERIKSVMIELGHEVSRLVVIVRGSVAAAKIREIMMKMNEFDSVSIISAFPSTLEKLIDEINQSMQNIDDNRSTSTSSTEHSEGLIEAVHEVGHASHREIQMRLWTSLIQEFVESSGGKLKWSRLLNFIETTSIQSLKSRTAPLKTEDGRRALTELLADDVLVAIRFAANKIYNDMDAGLWIVNSTILEEIRNAIITSIIAQIDKKGMNPQRNHGFFDICDTRQSYIIFPTQEQLQTILDKTESEYCRTCHTSRVLCVLPASEYLLDKQNIPNGCTIVAVDSDFELLMNLV